MKCSTACFAFVSFLFLSQSPIVKAQGADISRALALGPDNYIYVTGSSMSATGKMDIITLAYDPNGRLQGSQRIATNDGSAGVPAGIIVQGNNIIVSGTNQDASTGYDIVTVSYPRSSLVGVENQHELPNEITLEQSYPNPLSRTKDEAVITFTLPTSDHVRLSVTDISGKEVALIVDEIKEAGTHHTTFRPGTLPTGMYYYTLQTRFSAKVKKMVVVR